jgi:hypothetical protein
MVNNAYGRREIYWYVFYVIVLTFVATFSVLSCTERSLLDGKNKESFGQLPTFSNSLFVNVNNKGDIMNQPLPNFGNIPKVEPLNFAPNNRFDVLKTDFIESHSNVNNIVDISNVKLNGNLNVENILLGDRPFLSYDSNNNVFIFE